MDIRDQPAPGAWQQRTMRRLAYACAVGLVAALILLAVYRTP